MKVSITLRPVWTETLSCFKSNITKRSLGIQKQGNLIKNGQFFLNYPMPTIYINISYHLLLVYIYVLLCFRISFFKYIKTIFTCFEFYVNSLWLNPFVFILDVIVSGIFKVYLRYLDRYFGLFDFQLII
jgi:hypothetical protein